MSDGVRELKPKEVKIPGPDHSITIYPFRGVVRVRVGKATIAESSQALLLEEAGYGPVFYIPRTDANMSLLTKTTHYSYCPYKGDCTYFSIPDGGSKAEYAVWSYEKPYDSVSEIKDHLAFYPTRVDAIEVAPAGEA